MSKIGGKMKRMKKITEKIDHSSKLRTNIPAGMATASPPLGSMLGQRNINIASFCKDFNERTKDIKEGIPLPSRVKVHSDRTYNLVIHKPPASYYLKQAAGIQIGKMNKDDKAGMITFKHLYEIAKIKSEDPTMALLSLKDVCNLLIGTARTCGIEIVRNLDVQEYAEFLKERESRVIEYKNELQSLKESKLLRTK